MTNVSPPRSGELVPEFSAGFPDNVTVQRESAAFLDCPVKNPGDRPVSYPLVNIILYYCLRSRPGSPDVVRYLLVMLKMTG